MNRFDKYIFGQLLVGMIFVTIGLTCVIWLTQSLKFVEMIVNRGLTTGTFVYLTMLLLPNFLSIVLPISLFTVVVFTYSKMISDRELIVMRATGLSQLALIKPAVILAVAVMALGYVINIFLLPQSYKMFRELQWDIRYSYSHILLQEGAFNEVSRGITVYVRKRTTDGQLHGILVHDEKNPEKPYTLLAERGAMIESDEGSRVIMFNGNRQEIDPNTKQLSILYFDRYIFEMQANKATGIRRFREARERTLTELLNPEDDPDYEEKNVGKFTVEAHKRLISPLLSFAYTIVGLAFLISGGFSRRAQTQRIVLAAFSVVAIQGGMLALENGAAKNLTMIPLLYSLSIVPMLGGLLAMHHTPTGKTRRNLAATG